MTDETATSRSEPRQKPLMWAEVEKANRRYIRKIQWKMLSSRIEGRWAWPSSELRTNGTIYKLCVLCEGTVPFDLGTSTQAYDLQWQVVWTFCSNKAGTLSIPILSRVFGHIRLMSLRVFEHSSLVMTDNITYSSQLKTARQVILMAKVHSLPRAILQGHSDSATGST